jgi:hypothetical protein
MLLSSTEETKSKAELLKIPEALRAIMQNMTVKLQGTSTRSFTFRGSGAILGTDGTNTWVVTAKHNLYVNAGHTSPPAWSDTLVTGFTSGIKIYFDTAMAFGKSPTQSADITSITPITIASDKPWEYDVMIVKSDNADLLRFAAANALGKPTSSELASYLQNSHQYLKREEQIFLQCGYGAITERVRTSVLPSGSKKGTAKEGDLQYRATLPEAKDTVSVHNQIAGSTYHTFTNAIRLDAGPETSTASGDSGGPLFVAYYHRDRDKSKSKWKAFLIGVTTGADMSTTKEPCPPGTKLRVNNIATSLEHCYSEGLLTPEASA